MTRDDADDLTALMNYVATLQALLHGKATVSLKISGRVRVEMKNRYNGGITSIDRWDFDSVPLALDWVKNRVNLTLGKIRKDR